MGWRNPFRIEIDPDTDDIWVADYSPDARAANPNRGPAGHGKWAVVDKPSNYGWPYCATAELPYNDFDFATRTSGPKFNCDAPVNDSIHNTGLRELPPVEQPEVWYSYGLSHRVPRARDRRHRPDGRPGVPVRQEGHQGSQPRRLAAALRRHPAVLRVDPRLHQGLPRRRRRRRAIEDVVPDIVTDNPMDMEFGPDGALYVLEYGDGYFAENPDAQLSRIDYIGEGGNRSPVPAIEAEPTAGKAPLTVAFSSEGTTDPDGDTKLQYAWDFDGDGKVDSRKARRDPTPTPRTAATAPR